jgi:hypothetical protein
MDYHIKKIETKEEKEKVIKLWMSHTKMMRTPINRDLKKINTILSSPSIETYGAFTEEKLIATTGISIWKKIPTYVINSQIVEKGIVHLYNYKNSHPLRDITNYIINIMEKKEYYSIYFTQALSPGLIKQHHTSQDIFRNSEAFWDLEKNQYRYDINFDEMIPAGKKSKYEIFNEIVDNEIYNVDILVFHACLKNEYRPWGDVLKKNKQIY